MKHLTLSKRILWTIAGFVVAFIIISLFEFANSLLYPFPKGMDMYDVQAVGEFARTLPTFAFVNVILGWAAGTYIATRLIMAKTHEAKLAYICAGILTVMAVINNFIMLPGIHPLWFHFVGLPIFFAVTYFVVKK